MLQRLPLAALALSLLTAGLAAQKSEPPSVVLPQVHDTGWVANEGTSRGAVISFPVQVEGAAWLRLKFSDVTLAGSEATGDASFLRVTSWSDGGQQIQHELHVSQWQRTTAYFNGDAVQVEVVAFPGSGPNRLRLESVTAGLVPAPLRSQCGPNDNRTPSSDNRACRILPVGCTAWVIDDTNACLLTAGHCSGAVGVAQFNVPPSNSNGSLNSPPPQDQYAVDSSSLQSNGGQGVGNDYAYFGVFPNSNTGLTPFQAYGVQYNLVNPPAFSSSHQIRITGYGVDGGTRNQVQQTHVGPRVNAGGTTLSYQTDTQGGNSGSPVILENTGQAIGIHTHGGCSTSGGGANNGTGANHPGLRNFLANPKGVCSNGPPPVAAFTGSPTAGLAPLAVSFTDQTIGGPASTWFWDFGDGSTSTQRNPNHTYTTGGKYDVTLTVTGPGGSDSEFKNNYIDVTAVPTIFTVTPSTIPALIPGTAETITIDGDGFSAATVVEVDGAPITTAFTRSGATSITFDMPELGSLGAHTVGIVDPNGSDTFPVTVVATATPQLQLGNGNAQFNTVFTALGLPMVMGGQPGALHLLVFSPEGSPSALPGVVSLCLGNGFNSVFLSNTYVIGANGLATDTLPIAGLAGLVGFGQSLNIDLPVNQGYPLEESNCQTFTVLF